MTLIIIFFSVLLIAILILGGLLLSETSWKNGFKTAASDRDIIIHSLQSENRFLYQELVKRESEQKKEKPHDNADWWKK